MVKIGGETMKFWTKLFNILAKIVLVIACIRVVLMSILGIVAIAVNFSVKALFVTVGTVILETLPFFVVAAVLDWVVSRLKEKQRKVVLPPKPGTVKSETPNCTLDDALDW